jgi:hypothetical protein
MTIWLMRIACWTNKENYTQSEYVLIIVFPLQQWFRERASILRYAYIACFTPHSLQPNTDKSLYHRNVSQ